jgi:hypothetical protein
MEFIGKEPLEEGFAEIYSLHIPAETYRKLVRGLMTLKGLELLLKETEEREEYEKCEFLSRELRDISHYDRN